MKLQIIADVHGDIDALNRALALGKKKGAQGLIVLGDVVEGVHPERARDNGAVVDRLSAAKPAIWLLGNHDIWAVRGARAFNNAAGDFGLAIGQAAFLGRQQKSYRDREALYVHASPLDTDACLAGVTPPHDPHHGLGQFSTTRALSDAGTRLLFVGHTHVAFVSVLDDEIEEPSNFELGDGVVKLDGRQAVINPGSCADPRQVGRAVLLGDGTLGGYRTDDPVPGSFALWDQEADTIELVAVPAKRVIYR